MTDEDHMRIALLEAKKCFRYKDVPVGAIIVNNGKVIAATHNQKERKKTSTAHAEILAINKASKKLGSYRLDDCVIYITKEPCLMCMGAILSARISKIIFGAFDPRFGTMDLAVNNKFNHKCEIVGGVCEDECKVILTNFFQELRGKNASFRKAKIKNPDKRRR